MQSENLGRATEVRDEDSIRQDHLHDNANLRHASSSNGITPYGDAAAAYFYAGWTGVLPLPPGEKSPPPSGFTGWNGKDPGSRMIELWRSKRTGDYQAASNIAIHFPDGIVGIDVDHYGAKTGLVTLADLEKELGPLPAGWMSTSRPGTGSGIRWFRVEPGLRWPTGPGKDIEFIHVGHRYAVVAPSIHDKTGAEYVWVDYAGEIDRHNIPAPDDLPCMPDEWQWRFTGGEQRTEQPKYRAPTEEESAACLTEGEMCKATANALAKWTERKTVQARHDAMLKVTYSLVRLGEQGHHGVRAALATFHKTFTEEVGPDRKDGSEHSEYQRAVNGAIARVSQSPTGEENRNGCNGKDGCGTRKDTGPGPEAWNPDERSLILPQSFYDSRTCLKEIQRYAHERCAAADGVLYATLARLSAMIPPTVRVDTGILSPASLNLFVAALGPAGGGKSSSASLSKRLYTAPAEMRFQDCLPLGSGEGLVESYFEVVSIDDPSGATVGKGKDERPKQIKVKMKTRSNAFFMADEGQAMLKMMEKNGSVLGETIRSLWMATTAGQSNANAETRRVMDEHTYSMGMLVGFQPSTVQKLLDDAAGGTPQRFVFCWVVDPTIPDDLEPNAPDGFFAEAVPTFQVKDTPVHMVQPVKDEIRRTHLDRKRGIATAPHMGEHDYLMKAKLASLLALMEDRHHVLEDDWELAGVMYDTHCNVRAAMVQYGKTHAIAETDMRNKANAVREGMAEAAREAAREAHSAPWRVAKSIATLIHDKGLRTVGAVNRKLAQRDKDEPGRIESAWELAESEGWVTVDGKNVEPGEQKPA